MTGKLAEYLQANGIDEAQAISMLESMRTEGKNRYFKAMENAWEIGDYEALFNLIVSNQRDKGNVLLFFSHHAGLLYDESKNE